MTNVALDLKHDQEKEWVDAIACDFGTDFRSYQMFNGNSRIGISVSLLSVSVVCGCRYRDGNSKIEIL